MEKNDIFVLVSKEIRKHIGSDRSIEMINNIQEIGLNSIDFIKLLIFIEDKFEFEFNDDELELENYVTIEDVINAIHSKLYSVK